MTTEITPCGVCVGQPLSSGRICICEGKGTEHAECQGLRKRLAELEIALGYYVNLPPQVSSCFEEVHERIMQLGYRLKEV